MISFTFDDFPRSALREGGAILKRHGVRGTYYVSLSLMSRELPAGHGFDAGDIAQLLADGHELGCHTFSHCDSWETKPDRFEASLAANRRALERLFPQTAFKTFSYPISCPRPESKRRAAKYFACCRGGIEGFNLGLTDAGNLRAFFLEKQRGGLEAVKRLILENRGVGGWLIFATHDVGANPTALGCPTALFDEIVRCAAASGASVLPVASAWEAIHDHSRIRATQTPNTFPPGGRPSMDSAPIRA